MKKIFTTHQTLPNKGSYQVDRIDDPIELIQGKRTKMEPTSFNEALKVFEKDPEAYALRFVPTTTLHPDSRGQLVAYKESDFPKDLPFLIYQVAALPQFPNGIASEQSHLKRLSSNATTEFREYYSHFPELLGQFHREVFLGLGHIQFAAMSNDAKTVYNWSKYVAELIVDYIASVTRYEDSQESLKGESYVSCLKIDEEPQADGFKGPFDSSGETVKDKLGANATSRGNVIQAVNSMFWNDVDQVLIQEQVSQFREDLVQKNLGNPMVYLEGDKEILAMRDPGELYYFIMMDDYWIRQFTYWLFNQLIKIYYELDGK